MIPIVCNYVRSQWLQVITLDHLLCIMMITHHNYASPDDHLSDVLLAYWVTSRVWWTYHTLASSKELRLVWLFQLCCSRILDWTLILSDWEESTTTWTTSGGGTSSGEFCFELPMNKITIFIIMVEILRYFETNVPAAPLPRSYELPLPSAITGRFLQGRRRLQEEE